VAPILVTREEKLRERSFVFIAIEQSLGHRPAGSCHWKKRNDGRSL